MLIGLLLLGIRAGTSDMTVLTQRHGAGLDSASQLLAFIAIALGLAIKSPLWPLHSWLPDAHTEAPTVGSVLLAGVLLKMGTYGLIRIAVPDLPTAAHDLAPTLAILATVAVVYGALCCLAQTDLKRLIAYSSVGHMGFVLLGIATLTSAGIDAALFGNIAHGLITGLLFFLVGGLKDRHHTGNIAAIGSGLFLRLPRYGALLMFAAVASLGLPGLAGFWGEVLALLAAYHPAAGLPVALFRVLMAAGFLGTLLTAGYFLLLLSRLAFGPVRPHTEPHDDVQAVEWLAWAPLVAGTLALGLYPRMLLAVTHPATLLLVAR
jgi:NADH-quinone oxidoreductase subunit M